MTTPTPEIPAVDPAWCLPDKPDATSRLTGPAFARLIAAAREAGWPGVYRAYSDGRVNADGRPAKRRGLDQLLSRREDLRSILAEAVEEKKTRLLSQLESVVERAATGGPDRTTDFRADGTVARVREDSRNRNYAAMWLLERTNPEQYASRKRIEGEISHDHKHQHAHAHLIGNAGGGYRVDFESVQTALSTDEARTLMDLLEKIENARLERGRLAQRQSQQQPALPPGESQ